MAIERVIAELGNSHTELKENPETIYSGELKTPERGGNYSATVKAYDDAGNVAIAKSNEIKVTIWKPPKTNWKSTDKFNWSDYNRIKNNLKWMHEKACELYKSFEIDDMGEDIRDYRTYWEVRFFNASGKKILIQSINICIHKIMGRDNGFMRMVRLFNGTN